MCTVRTVPTILLLCSTAMFTLSMFTMSMLGQGRGGGGQAAPIPPGPPKNLRVLPADTNIQQTMGAFRTALGVQCTYCHVQGDFASDDNAKKSMARNMIRIAADINAGFPDGKRHVTCYTCHRGEAVPKMEAAAPKATPAPKPPE
jgi:hypothetical protein